MVDIAQALKAPIVCKGNSWRAWPSYLHWFGLLKMWQYMAKIAPKQGILAKYITKMNDTDIGGYMNYALPHPANTWYWS